MTKKSLLLIVFAFLMTTLAWANTPTTSINKLNTPQMEQKGSLSPNAIQITSSAGELIKTDIKKMSFKEKLTIKLLKKKVSKFEKRQAKRAKKGKSTKDISDISLSGLFVAVGLILIILGLVGLLVSSTVGGGAVGGTIVLGLILVLIGKLVL